MVAILMKFKVQSSKFKISIQNLKVLILFTFNFLLLTSPVYADTELDCNPEKPVPGIDIGCYFGFGADSCFFYNYKNY